MGIIKSHDITLRGGDTEIVLRPLRDEHLPLLYKWNADPEVLYWTEGGKDIGLPERSIRFLPDYTYLLRTKQHNRP